MRSFVALSLILLSTFPVTLAYVTNIQLTKVHRNGAYSRVTRAADHSGVTLVNQLETNQQYYEWKGPISVPVAGIIEVAYTAKIGVGIPPTYYDLLIDTGSSNTWVGAGTPYVQTPTSIPTREKFNITYGSGSVFGDEYLDRVTVAPGLVIANQSIGAATNTTNLTGIDGIMGLGPIDLTNGTLVPNVNQTVPTITDNMASQRLIGHEVVSLYLAPAINANLTSARGIMTFGGVDSSLYNGEVNYVPLTKTPPASYFWGVDVISCTFGNRTIISNTTAFIVDSGTSLLLFSEDTLSAYVELIPGAFYNSTLSVVEVPEASLSSVKPLVFALGDMKITLDMAAQILPRDQNTQVGGEPDRYYALVGTFGNLTTIPPILGLTVLERYYTVFDTENKRVGFAETNNTYSTYPC